MCVLYDAESCVCYFLLEMSEEIIGAPEASVSPRGGAERVRVARTSANTPAGRLKGRFTSVDERES